MLRSMDIRRAVSEFVKQGGDLFNRLCSHEATILTPSDLHMLRVQLYILDTEAKSLERKQAESKPSPPKS